MEQDCIKYDHQYSDELENSIHEQSKNSQIIKLTVNSKMIQSERIDKWLLNQNLKISRSTLTKLFEQQKVKVDGIVCKKNYKVTLN